MTEFRLKGPDKFAGVKLIDAAPGLYEVKNSADFRRVVYRLNDELLNEAGNPVHSINLWWGQEWDDHLCEGLTSDSWEIIRSIPVVQEV